MRACHPGPCLVISTIIVALAAKSRPGLGDLIVFAIAVLAGQISIGWSNDVFDAGRDRSAGRSDKPIAAGQIDRAAVACAAVIALALSVALCFGFGAVTGVINVVMMVAAWAYNAGLKATLASGVMYVIGFGPIPLLARSLSGNAGTTSRWIVAAAALLALGGHFTNVLPDLGADRATGVDGLPQRLAGYGGAGLVRGIALVLLLGASAMAAAAARRSHPGPALVGLPIAVIIATVGARAGGRGPFLAALGIALIDVALVVEIG